jgi:hypothetical protein
MTTAAVVVVVVFPVRATKGLVVASVFFDFVIDICIIQMISALLH